MNNRFNISISKFQTKINTHATPRPVVDPSKIACFSQKELTRSAGDRQNVTYGQKQQQFFINTQEQREPLKNGAAKENFDFKPAFTNTFCFDLEPARQDTSQEKPIFLNVSEKKQMEATNATENSTFQSILKRSNAQVQSQGTSNMAPKSVTFKSTPSATEDPKQKPVTEIRPKLETSHQAKVALKSLKELMHEETEKIQSWKRHAEEELKRKDNKLHHSEDTIQKLRKSTLELQLLNEKLNSKIEDDERRHDETLAKVHSTKEMCNAIKSYFKHMTTKLTEFEKEKDDILANKKKEEESLKDLMGKFQEMSINMTKAHEVFSKTAKIDKVNSDKMKAMYEEKLCESSAKLKSLSEFLNKRKTAIQTLQNRLKDNQTKCKDLLQTYNSTCKLLEETKAERDDLKGKLKDESTLKEDYRAQVEEFRQRYEEAYRKMEETMAYKEKLAESFTEAETMYLRKIEQMMSENKKYLKDLEETQLRLKQQVTECSNVQATAEGLQKEKETLLMEKYETHEQVHSMHQQQLRLQSEYEQVKDEAARKDNELQRKEHALETLKSQMEEAKRILDGQIADMEIKLAQKAAETDDLHTQVENMKKEINDIKISEEQKMMEISSLEQQVSNLNNSVSTLQQDVAGKEKHVVEAMNDAKEAQETVSALQEELREIQAKLDKKSGETALVSDKVSSITSEKQALQKELTLTKKELTKSQKALEKMKKSVEKLTANMKEMEELNEAQSNEITLWATKNQQMESQMQDLNGEKENLQSVLDETRNSLVVEKKMYLELEKTCDAHVVEINNLETQVDQLRHQNKDNEEKEKIASCRLQAEVRQMENILEECRKANELRLNCKQLELEELQKQSEVFRRESMEFRILKRDVADLESKLAELHSQKDQQIYLVETVKQQMAVLQGQQAEKDRKIQTLVEENELLAKTLQEQIKVPPSVCSVATSPPPQFSTGSGFNHFVPSTGNASTYQPFTEHSANTNGPTVDYVAAHQQSRPGTATPLKQRNGNLPAVPQTPWQIPTTSMATPQTPKVMLQTPKAVPQTPKAIPQTPKALLQTPKVVPQTPKAMLQTPKVMLQTPKAMLQTPKAVPQIPKAVPQTPKRPPNKLLQTTTTGSSTNLDFKSATTTPLNTFIPLKKVSTCKRDNGRPFASDTFDDAASSSSELYEIEADVLQQAVQRLKAENESTSGRQARGNRNMMPPPQQSKSTKPNVRIAPKRSPGKFFKSPAFPQSKMSKFREKHKNVSGASWFDSDDVFRFSPDE